MNCWRAMYLLGLAGAALALQGCLAVAIPVVAASGMATRDVVKQGRDTPASDVQTAEFALTPVDADDAGIAGNSALTASLVADSVPGKPSDFSADPVADTLSSLSIYSGEQLVKGSGEEGIVSAVLQEPGALNGKRRRCEDEAPAILIDLDPAGELFDPGTPPGRSTRMTNILDNLRNQGIQVGWISAQTADRAGAVEAWLKASLFDADGKDRLLLMRYPDDRKQTRRAEFAAGHCLIAIMGNEPSDFDELYTYLKEPALAAPLETLYGNGWFLTPSMLAQEQE